MLQIKKNEENIIKIGRTFPIIYMEYQQLEVQDLEKRIRYLI